MTTDEAVQTLGALSKADRHAAYKEYERRGQLFCVEYSTSGRATCRGCRRPIPKDDIRIRHIVCGRKCFLEKRTGAADACGRWHLQCFVGAQTTDAGRFKTTNASWEVVRRPDQLAGMGALSDSDQARVAAVLRGGDVVAADDHVVVSPRQRRSGKRKRHGSD